MALHTCNHFIFLIMFFQYSIIFNFTEKKVFLTNFSFFLIIFFHCDFLQSGWKMSRSDVPWQLASSLVYMKFHEVASRATLSFHRIWEESLSSWTCAKNYLCFFLGLFVSLIIHLVWIKIMWIDYMNLKDV